MHIQTGSTSNLRILGITLGLLLVFISISVGLVAIFLSHLPAWQQNLQKARLSSYLDIFDNSGHTEINLARATSIECAKASTKLEKAKILYYAITIMNTANTHECEEIIELAFFNNCSKELAENINALPKTEWDKLNKEQKRSLRSFLEAYKGAYQDSGPYLKD
jgi:hypothetical protein